MSERLVRLNGGNGKGSDSSGTLLVIVVTVAAIVIIWFFYKTSIGCQSTPPTTTPPTALRAPLKAVVSPAPPVVKPSSQPDDEKVKVVKVKADSAEPYETSQLNQDTIENPDFLMQIGREPMTEVRNKVKSIDDIQYSTPQDLLGIDAVLQADQQVQAEDTTLHTGASLIFGTGINTPRNLRGGMNWYAGDVQPTSNVAQQINQQSVTSSSKVNYGYFGSPSDDGS